MTSATTKADFSQPAAKMAVDHFDTWFDPIEAEGRARARELIEEMIRGEPDTVLAHRVTVEARWPATKEEPALWATDTGAGRGR
jgi:hypothetical protein